MKKTQKIVEFIKEYFDEFSLDYKKYFYYDFRENNLGKDTREEIVWIDEAGEIDMHAVEHASEVLGISVEDILSTNEKAPLKWLKKYPYFGNVKPFNFAYEKTFYGNGFDYIHLMETIFDTKSSEPYPQRFSYSNIKKRLVEQLIEFDRFLPGTYHKNADITELEITTRNFCNFSNEFANIKKMTESFISMIENATTLFLKAVKTDLTIDESREYNLLVSALGLRDKYYTKGYLYYSQLVKVKEVYASANFDNINDYIVFKRALEFQPWRCTEFVKDKELVQKYISVLPQAIGYMQDYAMNVSSFNCSFIWSDAEPIIDSPEEEAYWNEIYKAIGEDPIPIEQRAKEVTTIYVEKTTEELNGDGETAEQLLTYCRPVNLGGLPVKINSNSIKRIEGLLNKVQSNNYIERIVEITNSNLSGGVGND